MKGYISDNCPNLEKQIARDIEAGTFSALGPLAGDAVMKYLGALAGREIHGNEVICKVYDEIELKLKRI